MKSPILLNFFGIHYVKIDITHGRVYVVESIFEVVHAKIGIGLTLEFCFALYQIIRSI